MSSTISSSRHLGREKTFASPSRDFYWPYMHKWVRKWVRSCEACQRVKPSHSKQPPLVHSKWLLGRGRPSACTSSSGFRDTQGHTGILVFVDRFSKIVHFAPAATTITAKQSAAIFLDIVYRHHGLPSLVVSDRDPRFTATFWQELFLLLGTRLKMSPHRPLRRMARLNERTELSKMFYEVSSLRLSHGALSYLTDGRVSHQQRRPCIDEAHPILRQLRAVPGTLMFLLFSDHPQRKTCRHGRSHAKDGRRSSDRCYLLRCYLHIAQQRPDTTPSTNCNTRSTNPRRREGSTVGSCLLDVSDADQPSLASLGSFKPSRTRRQRPSQRQRTSTPIWSRNRVTPWLHKLLLISAIQSSAMFARRSRLQSITERNMEIEKDATTWSGSRWAIVYYYPLPALLLPL